MTCEQCIRFDTCQVISSIRDRDMTDFQYVESLEKACQSCDKWLPDGQKGLADILRA